MLMLFPPQIFVISQAEPRLPLQLDDAVRPDGDGEEVSVGDGLGAGGVRCPFRLVRDVLLTSNGLMAS